MEHADVPGRGDAKPAPWAKKGSTNTAFPRNARADGRDGPGTGKGVEGHRSARWMAASALTPPPTVRSSAGRKTLACPGRISNAFTGMF